MAKKSISRVVPLVGRLAGGGVGRLAGCWVGVLAGCCLRVSAVGRLAGFFLGGLAVVFSGARVYPCLVGWGRWCSRSGPVWPLSFPLGVFVVFVLVGSCRVVVASPVSGCWVSASRASLLLLRLRCLRASRRRVVAARRRRALVAWAAVVSAPVFAPAVPVGAPVVRSCVFGVWVSSSRRACALLRRSRRASRLGGVLSPLPVSFPPAVWSPPSPAVRVAVVALVWRSRCPAGGSLPCSRCPFALVSLPAVASACGVSVRSLFSVPALFSLPSVPVSWCSCLLSGLRCVSLRGLLPPGFSG